MTKTSSTKPRPTSSAQTSRRSTVRKPAPAKKSLVAPGDASGAVASARTTKLDLITNLLRGPAGASISELVAATGWQPHSVRGAMSGALKRKGLTVTSFVIDGVRRYRIGAPE